MANYFDGITSTNNSYLFEAPRKAEVLANAKKDGKASILPDSNNRAITIKADGFEFLQSYDTLIIEVDTNARTIKKLWDGYSKTTLKHVNEFLKGYGLTFNKKEWEAFTTANY